MKKVLLLFLLCIVIISCTTNDDGFPAPDNKVDINEGQQNWTKLALADRKAGQLNNGTETSFSATDCGVIFSDDSVSLVYVNHAAYNPVSEIYRSDNAGNNWVKIKTMNGVITDAASQNHVCAILLNSGMQKTVLWSNDLMNTYSQYNTNLTFNRIEICNDSILLCTNNNGIFRSSNQGQNWVSVNSGNFSRMFRFDAGKYFVLQNNRLLFSSDTCKSFSTLFTGPSDLKSLYVLPGNTVFLGSDAGDIYRSDFGGGNIVKKFCILNPYPSATGVVVSDIRMVDPMNGFATIQCDNGINTGNDFEYTTGIVLRTVDGGETWNVSYRSQLMFFTHLIILNGPNVIAAGKQDASESLGKVYICITKTLGI